MRFNLEQDLYANAALLAQIETDRSLADELYAALCNNQFRHREMHPDAPFWSCSWRYAGGIVAELTDPSRYDYLDFYCGGNEGYISPRVEALLDGMGWVGNPWPDEFLL